MARRDTAADLQRIVELIQLRGDLSAEALETSTGIPRRTLQRYLDGLIPDRIERTGKGRATRYRALSPGTAASQSEIDTTIPLSSAAKKLRARVRLPIHLRPRVGYNRDFLEAYRPNHSFYLDPATRRELELMGKTPDEGLPAGTFAREILQRLLIDLSFNSSRLEGNTYSLLETQRLIELGENAEGRDVVEAQMIVNHKAAIEMLVDGAGQVGFNAHTLRNLHAILADGLLADPSAAGQIRQISVGITGSPYLPLAVPQLIQECFDQILYTANAITDPFEQAFFGMVHLPYLQPFIDVNKRVSRLAANIPLIRLNLRPLSFIDVSQNAYVEGLLGVYEFNDVSLLRDVFIWAYDRSCRAYPAVRQSLPDPDPFRLRHRNSFYAVIKEIIQSAMDQPHAQAHVELRAQDIAPEERSAWTQLTLRELSAVHEGNFVRFGVSEPEFQRWWEQWEKCMGQLSQF